MRLKMNDLKQVFIIAEIGVNHNGSMELAKELISKAHEAGVDAVKFQTFKAKNLLASKNIEKAPYQKREDSLTQYEMLKKLEFSYEQFKQLKHYCDEKNLAFLSTPYDGESVELLKDLDVSVIKIASADLVNKPLLEAVLKADLDIILSTGMATFEEIERTVAYIFEKKPSCALSILHCTTSYPTHYGDVHMNILLELKKRYGKRALVGYSDHTVGNEIAVMAVAQGAKIIEKHFTLDRNMEGPDHFASAEPNELCSLVQQIRHVERAFGCEEKKLTGDEKVNIQVMRRSIHAKQDLPKGHVLSVNDLTFTRPYDGYSVWEYEKVLGKKLLTDIATGQPIHWSDLA